MWRYFNFLQYWNERVIRKHAFMKYEIVRKVCCGQDSLTVDVTNVQWKLFKMQLH